jgi:hypothetical protein
MPRMVRAKQRQHRLIEQLARIQEVGHFPFVAKAAPLLPRRDAKRGKGHDRRSSREDYVNGRGRVHRAEQWSRSRTEPRRVG